MNETILFLLVNNMTPTNKYGGTSRSGLMNSATMTAQQLTTYLHYSTVVDTVPSAAGIIEKIKKYKPKFVILEAIWVTADQVLVLTQDFPDTVFITRVHSEVPFLAHENGVIAQLQKLASIHNSYIAFNSRETERQFFTLGYRPAYLPNIFTDVYQVEVPAGPFCSKTMNVGCFGSIRPMKNQLLQAMMAAAYCDIHKIELLFHMNTSRVEQQGGCALGNIRAFFEGTEHTLIEHDWLDRADFLKLVKGMDLMLQLSFNESFNIVSADAVLMGVPLVVSDTIGWMPEESRASVDSMDDILYKIDRVLKRRQRAVGDNIRHLDRYNMGAVSDWSKFLKSI